MSIQFHLINSTDEKLPPIYKYPSVVYGYVHHCMPRADLDPNANEQFEAMPCTRLITTIVAAKAINTQQSIGSADQRILMHST